MNNPLLDHSRDGCQHINCAKCGWKGWSDSGCLGCEIEPAKVTQKMRVQIPIWIEITVEATSDEEARKEADREFGWFCDAPRRLADHYKRKKDGVMFSIEEKGMWDVDKD